MATFTNVIQPNGASIKLKSGSDEERLATARELLSKWEPYCEKNWISVNHADTFCGENKVKRFFSGLTYFLLLGSTEGMVTNYKEIMNGKREIPISSCPSQIEDQVYGTGPVLRGQSEDDETMFLLSEQVPQSAEKKRKHAMRDERDIKIKQIREDCGYDAAFSYCVVDTEYRFKYGGCVYRIDESVEAYAPKRTALGTLWDMDKVVCVKSKDGQIRFYTAKYDPIPEEKVFMIG